MGVRQDASPHQHTARLGLEAGQDFWLDNSALRLTPIVGLDYTYAWQSSFKENNLSGIALDVDSEDFNSLRAKIGLDTEYALTDNLSLGGYGFYRLETLDTHADLSTQMIGTAVRFETTGQDYERSSGNLGASLDYAITEQISTRAGYDFTFGDHYQGHQLDLSLIWEF